MFVDKKTPHQMSVLSKVTCKPTAMPSKSQKSFIKHSDELILKPEESRRGRGGGRDGTPNERREPVRDTERAAKAAWPATGNASAGQPAPGPRSPGPPGTKANAKGSVSILFGENRGQARCGSVPGKDGVGRRGCSPNEFGDLTAGVSGRQGHREK